MNPFNSLMKCLDPFIKQNVHRCPHILRMISGYTQDAKFIHSSQVHGPSSAAAAVAAKSLQSCLTLCDPTDGNPPGSAIPGILLTRTLEWVAASFSNAGRWKVKVKSLSRVDSSRPHGLQPTRLRRPWDSPGKSTGVGCHCLLRPSSAEGSNFSLERARE